MQKPSPFESKGEWFTDNSLAAASDAQIPSYMEEIHESRIAREAAISVPQSKYIFNYKPMISFLQGVYPLESVMIFEVTIWFLILCHVDKRAFVVLNVKWEIELHENVCNYRVIATIYISHLKLTKTNPNLIDSIVLSGHVG